MSQRRPCCLPAVIVTIVLLATAGRVQGGAVVAMDTAELTRHADRIVVGDVTDLSPAWNGARTLITTRVVVTPTDYIKGDPRPREALQLVGGSIDGLSLASTDTPRFELGDHVLLFLDAEDRLVGAFQGAYLTDGDMAVQTDGGVWRFRPSTLVPLQRLYDEIVEALPPGAVPGALSPYTGTFTLPGSRFVTLGYDWRWTGNPMGEDYVVNGNCADPSAGSSANQIAAITLGAEAWTNSGARFQFTYGGPSSSTADGFDGVNLIFFCPSGSCGMPAQTVAVTRIWFSGDDLLEWDMVFNDAAHEFWDGVTGPCGGTRADLQSFAAHEFGHGLGLDHTAEAAATMFPTGGLCDLSLRTLHQDDIDGVIDIYGPASNSGPGFFLGESAGDKMGFSVANAGDVDDDGYDDIIAGAPYNDEAGLNAGKVYVFSGRTGATLYTRRGSAAGDRLGWAVAGAGDVDDDDHDDFIVGAPYASGQRGRIKVYSGRNGSRLHSIRGDRSGDRYGQAVGGGEDIDDDGRDDFIVGAPHNDDAGRKAGKVYLYSGRNGQRMGVVRGEHSGDKFGWAVAMLRRANGDSHADFAVAAPLNDDRASKAGKVYVYSGDDRDLLYTLKGERAGDQFGRALAAIGRADDDGRTDIVVGAPFYDRSGSTNAGRVYAFSGRDGDRLWRRSGAQGGNRLGWAVGGDFDANDDGRDDVVCGAPLWGSGADGAGRVYIRSGVDGSQLRSIIGDQIGDQFGSAVAGLDDLYDDGSEDVVASSPFNDGAASNAGRIDVLNLELADGPPDRSFTIPALEPAGGCPEDRTGDGIVDARDLTDLLITWDEPDALDASNVAELVELLAAWGR